MNLAPLLSPTNLAKLATTHNLSESDCRRLVGLLGRQPTLTELGVFGALWSEHCSYRSTKHLLARLPSEGEKVVVGPGENAGVVNIDGDLCVVFKMESHNHPSFIDPYNGASTGVGGIMRDVFCMGARPIANLNALRFAPQHRETLLAKVIKGISDYGNCVGVPTVGGNISLDSRYGGNCLVNVMTVGVCQRQDLHFARAGNAGNLLVYLGAKTGRDGISGANMASQNLADSEQRSCVQVGDPFFEKLLMEATLELLQNKLLVGLQDLGAAGLTSSLFEVAQRSQMGMSIDLDRVPLRVTEMTAPEIMLSESQERMLLVVDRQKLSEVERVCRKWLLDGVVIGEVTTEQEIVINHRQQIVVRVAINDPRIEALELQHPKTEPEGITTGSRQTVADKSFIYQQFDRTIGQRTVRASDDGGAAVMWLRDLEVAPYLGLAIASAGLEELCADYPRYGAAQTVMKVARMIYAVGGQPLAMTDCLNFADPHDPQVIWQLEECIDGLAEASKALDVPIVSGNVSLFNSNQRQAIPPTPMIGMVGKVLDIRNVPSAICKSDHHSCYLLSPREVMEENDLPVVNWQYEIVAGKLIAKLLNQQMVSCVRDVGSAGLQTTLTAMSLPTISTKTVAPLGSYLFVSDRSIKFAQLTNDPLVVFSKL